MRTILFLFLLGFTSCVTTRTISYDPSYDTRSVVVTTPVVTITPTPIVVSQPRPFGWFWRPSYFWTPRTTYLGNVYHSHNHYHVNPTPRVRTNLPLNTGPRGGRRGK